MTDLHPAVAFLRAVHQHAAVLAHQGLGEPYDRVPPVVDALAVRAARMNYTPVHPSALLRRVEAEREILAEHSVTRPWRRCRVCISDRDGYPESWTGDLWPCRTVLGLAKAWGWEAET